MEKYRVEIAFGENITFWLMRQILDWRCSFMIVDIHTHVEVKFSEKEKRYLRNVPGYEGFLRSFTEEVSLTSAFLERNVVFMVVCQSVQSLYLKSAMFLQAS